MLLTTIQMTVYYSYCIIDSEPDAHSVYDHCCSTSDVFSLIRSTDCSLLQQTIDRCTWLVRQPFIILCLAESYLFLADRTNGRAYATVLRPSVVVCLSSVTLCIVAKRCVLEQKLLLRAYRKSYMRNRLVPK